MGGKSVIRTGKVGKPAKNSKQKTGYEPCHIFIHRDPKTRITTILTPFFLPMPTQKKNPRQEVLGSFCTV